MYLQKFYTPNLAINTYLIGDVQSKRGAVIDPTREIDLYIKAAHQAGFEITDILETHVHADFISGAKELKYRLQDKPFIHCSAMGGAEWTPKYADKAIQDGDEINLGAISLRALHTPGHTPEHLIWLCYEELKDMPRLAFTGDLLFADSVGRPDLLGKVHTQNLATQLYHSLFTTLEKLPDLMEIFPAHGAGSLCGKGLSTRPTSTLGYERQFNPYFVKKPLQEWTNNLLKDTSIAPINFQRMKKLNIQGLPLVSLTPKASHSLTIDLRQPESFAKSHLKDSINIPLGSNFCNWISSILNEDMPLSLVVETPEQILEAVKNLHLIGFDRIIRHIVWNDNRKEFPTAQLSLISAEELAQKIQNAKLAPYVLDVRTLPEWEAGHIENAHHIELTQLTAQADQIPKDASVFVICGSGYRASIAASWLQSQGYSDVANIKDGMQAWKKAKLPTQ
jgi:hydroxyacylglutathione hydrolase